MTHFQSGGFPKKLKLAEVTPVYKKKEPFDKDPLNHLVSVLLHVSKTFEKITYK